MLFWNLQNSRRPLCLEDPKLQVSPKYWISHIHAINITPRQERENEDKNPPNEDVGPVPVMNAWRQNLVNCLQTMYLHLGRSKSVGDRSSHFHKLEEMGVQIQIVCASRNFSSYAMSMVDDATNQLCPINVRGDKLKLCNSWWRTRSMSDKEKLTILM